MAYIIIETKTQQQVGRPYSTRRVAMRTAVLLNNKQTHGYGYHIRNLAYVIKEQTP